MDEAQARQIAEAWAEHGGLGGYPLDLQLLESVPQLPGCVAVFEVLHGDSDVRVQTYETLPALLRGGGADEDWAARFLRGHEYGTMPLELGLRAQPEIGGYNGGGPKALRHALAKVTEKRLALLGELGEFLVRVKRAGDYWEAFGQGPTILQESVLEELDPVSPASGPGAELQIIHHPVSGWCMCPEYGPSGSLQRPMWYWRALTGELED